ncbi:2-iminoacetate synthase [Desulfonatronum thiosulfatophilum]|uniref:2-iminoacetate synthase n=1 Tax=Desulfonatronum thiosulfatophilum TaxID=617002 RepID=A0A1G6C731_9BACT|nr:2-iminoacetate synthase ThiH [Desulfonatronum thiosulfatophilum]SDB28608.1 2-iminoacetate synthase [Desulfonatronum thiosulfatophilum]
MSFHTLLDQYRGLDVPAAAEACTEQDVIRALGRDRLGPDDLLALLSPAAGTLLEALAQEAAGVTLRHFGRSVQLFIPLYISDHCTNRCVYCGFNSGQVNTRRQLSLEEIRSEARDIAATGLKQILMLTGDAPRKAPLDYLEKALGVLREFFPSLVLEVYALTTSEYARLIAAGAEGLTIYQETYDPALYEQVHLSGPKRDYAFRLDAPERGCLAGMRWVGISALYGLGDWRVDAFWTAMHARWLQDRYPGTEIGVSLPRMRPHAGDWQPDRPVSDRDLTQILLAQRLYLPRASITLSTRESARLRENLLPLGVTRLSAGVSTSVGGHGSSNAGTPQFEVNDPRTVEEIAAMLRGKGFQPVFKDWQPLDRKAA